MIYTCFGALSPLSADVTGNSCPQPATMLTISPMLSCRSRTSARSPAPAIRSFHSCKDHIQEVLDKWTQIDDEIWAKVIVLERNRRVAKAYARAPVLTINGSDDGFDGFR
ncbi:hypothetical protein J6590_030052 [Homalodisca vitripennis]|nr:hypothetical protein J6590_030052 [Homalodisca vitripennis]